MREGERESKTLNFFFLDATLSILEGQIWMTWYEN